ncbi:hypothetical protein K523DRAFT_323289 [Schizophyllum commune Tattone D]|nr:hypothetical protein K523DRAFT_323289 [Schizophyllum commune Tattone D]
MSASGATQRTDTLRTPVRAPPTLPSRLFSGTEQGYVTYRTDVPDYPCLMSRAHCLVGHGTMMRPLFSAYDFAPEEVFAL